MAKKTAIPSMSFNTSIWLKDPVVRSLAPCVRGMWIDMLCYMWESAERGVMLKPNQEIYTKDEILRLVGYDSDGGSSWIDILCSSGLCAIREDGAYYSRRMVRLNEISSKRREAGKKGGNKTKEKLSANINAPTAIPEVPDLFDNDPQQPPPTDQQQKKTEKVKKKNYAEFVTLTDDEYKKLVDKYTEPAAKRMIEILDNYKGSKGKKYKSDYRTILNWVVDRYYEEVNKNGTQWMQTHGGTNNSGNKAVPGGTQYANQSTGEHGDMETPKDYSQRF